MNRPLNRGFTLIEVLLAIGITAIISLGAFQVIRTVMDSKRAIDFKSERLTDLQRLDFVMKRDVTQMLEREVIDVSGMKTHSIILDDDGSEYLLEFSRLGWKPSPVSKHKRSAIQRVAYQFEDINSDVCAEAKERYLAVEPEEQKGSCFVRYYWTVLDRMSDTEPMHQILFDFVEPDSEVELVVELRKTNKNAAGASNQDQKNEIRTVKTTSDVRLSTDQEGYVKAVILKLQVPNLGLFERYWATPEVKITNVGL